MKQATLLFLSVFLGIFCPLVLATVGSHATLHVCNRGFCYNKRAEWIPSNTPSLQNQKRRKPCTEPHCELAHILRNEYLLQQEAMECLDCPPASTETKPENENDTSTSSQLYNLEFDILQDVDLDERKSWKEEPKRGKCQDENMGDIFDCNLIEILDEGTLLIEDLRDGGHLAAQPKSGFSNKKRRRRIHQEPTPPSVVVTGEVPHEDFRTIVELNMMGI